MSTSGESNFDLQIREIVEEAFERCGIDPASLTARHVTSARRSLDLLFSEWSNKGPHLWAIDQQSVTLTQGTAAYETPVGTIALLDMVRRRDHLDTPIFPMMARMMSLAVTPFPKVPSMLMRIVRGFCCQTTCVARTCATSEAPMPKARAPNAPCVPV